MPDLDLSAALTVRNQRLNSRPPAQLMLAWVVSSVGSTVTVVLSDSAEAEPLTVPRVRAYSAPQVNDVVIIAKSGRNLYCLGALNSSPVPPPNPENAEPEPPSGGGTSGGEMSPTPPPVRVELTKTFRPTFTGTYLASAWRDDTTDLYQGQVSISGVNYGAAYYGVGPSGLTGAAVSGTVRIRRLSGGSRAPLAPTLRLLTDKDQPEGFPSFSAEIFGPALVVDEPATVDLPVSWVAELLAGTAGGIGIGGGDYYMRLAGTSNWAPAMELTITYRS